MDGLRIGENDLRVLCRLRNDSRENLTKMSRVTKIPVSTLHDKLRRFKTGLIDKNTVIMDFKKIGYDLKVTMLLKVPSDNREKFRSFLKMNKSINSLYRVNNGYDFMAEALFRNMKEFKDFTDKIDSFGVNNVREFFVLEDLKREGFLTQEVFD